MAAQLTKTFVIMGLPPNFVFMQRYNKFEKVAAPLLLPNAYSIRCTNAFVTFTIT